MTADPRLERLNALLPAFYRARDEVQGGALQQLLRVIAEQVNVLEDDIAQLYDNWFIETAQDWAVPYIGELIGYTPVPEASQVGATRNVDRILFPRREVANTIRARRRKGSLALLEDLSRDVAGWPARATEFSRLVVQSQHVNHLRPGRGRSVDVRRGQNLDLLGTPFDSTGHSVDVRRINSLRRSGRYNLPSVGLFLWRLQVFAVTEAPAACIEEVGPNCYTFNVLGHDAPLFTKPEVEPEDHLAAEINLPVAIRRQALALNLPHYYGPGRSFVIYRGKKQGNAVVRSLVPASSVVVADLSTWAYPVKRDQVAVDPVLGRITFHPRENPAGVWVSYHTGFSAEIGGGEYGRPPHPRLDATTFYQRVSKKGKVSTLQDALQAWQKSAPRKKHAVLEIMDSELYSEQLNITLEPGEHLEIRAANRKRPVIYLLDRERNLPDALTVIGEALPDSALPDSKERCQARLTLDGLLIAGRAVHIEGALSAVCIRHCTLVPGWGLGGNCEPLNPSKPSLELYQTNARINISHSILGAIQVYQDEVKADPTELYLSDSIVDATSSEREAIGAPNWPKAHATLHLRRCTVIGQVQTHAIALAENSIFTGEIQVARQQVGCMRFCAVVPRSRTPRRYHCQPDLAEDTVRGQANWVSLPTSEQERQLNLTRQHVQPVFDSLRYGQPSYARLSLVCPPEISRGADDEGEMGAFHDLFQPQRLINLQTRLEEYTPARTDVGIIFAD